MSAEVLLLLLAPIALAMMIGGAVQIIAMIRAEPKDIPDVLKACPNPLQRTNWLPTSEVRRTSTTALPPSPDAGGSEAAA